MPSSSQALGVRMGGACLLSGFVFPDIEPPAHCSTYAKSRHRPLVCLLSGLSEWLGGDQYLRKADTWYRTDFHRQQPTYPVTVVLVPYMSINPSLFFSYSIASCSTSSSQ